MPVSGWRVPGLGQTPAFGVPAFQGLTPPLAALLLTRYSQPEQLVLDLTADLAVEGVAGAGGRRYAAARPATAEILACTRQRGTWPAAALLLIRWPPQHATEPGWGPDLPELLRECRDLLAPDGHLIAVVGLGHADPPARAHDVIEAAARVRLRLDHRHVILTAPARARADETPTPPSSPTGTSTCWSSPGETVMTDRDPRPEHPSAFENRRGSSADEELLTVDDVCAWFQVTRDWVYDEVEAGRLPFLRLGRKHLRFDRGELVGYLKAATGRRSSPQQPSGQAIWTAGLEPLD